MSTEDWDRNPLSGREMMRVERERLRQRAPLLFRPDDRPPVPSGPLPRFEMVPGVVPDRPVPTGVGVLKVACPACKAAVGMPCFIPSSPDKRPHGGTHPSRRDVSAGVSSE